MIIPYYDEIVNIGNKDDFDMHYKNKFIGLITPEGKIFKNNIYGHSYSPAYNMLNSFFNYELNFPQEQLIEKLNKRKELIKDVSHEDKVFLLVLIDWEINYAKNYYNLDSIFMEKFLKLGLSASADYLVQLLDFDKVERLPKTITTSKISINKAFFNYLIMDYNIVQIPKVLPNPTTGDFGYFNSNEYIEFNEEKEYEEEIKLIKQNIPLNKRRMYFK